MRHGEPAWTTAEGLGRNDPGLTERGQAQARMLATRIADPDVEPALGPVDRLLVSPAVRAQETATPIADALDMKAETLDWLWELRNPPAWEGAPVEVIQEAFNEIKGRDRAGWWRGLHGGESPRDFHQRVTRGLRSLLADAGMRPASEEGLWLVEEDAPQRIVLVAHGGTNSTIVAHLLGVPPEPWEWERFTMGHASVALLVTAPLAGAHLWSLRALGDAGHLPIHDRTR
ncbi:MAG: Alpha-ribazole-5-phosphate phosphatase [Acidimicrobiales bacterium]|nr:Alpha-ribazole-5-phosphate phosphatase [Acidimicrobiales bacterium]